MKSLKYILILSILIVTSCKSQVENEIEKAHEIVEQAIQETNSEEWKSEQRQFNSEIELEKKFNILINNSEDSLLIKGKDSIIAICNLLFSELETSQQLLEEKHGLDKNGDLKNKMETEFVNEIFIKRIRGQKIKDQIQITIGKLLEVSNNLKLGISQEEIPLKLNLFMEENDESWESYTFKDMPAIGVVPIIQKYQRDIVLTKLMILEKIGNKTK